MTTSDVATRRGTIAFDAGASATLISVTGSPFIRITTHCRPSRPIVARGFPTTTLYRHHNRRSPRATSRTLASSRLFSVRKRKAINRLRIEPSGPTGRLFPKATCTASRQREEQWKWRGRLGLDRRRGITSDTLSHTRYIRIDGKRMSQLWSTDVTPNPARTSQGGV